MSPFRLPLERICPLLIGAWLALVVPSHAAGQILVVVPHPDDDTIIASSLVWRAHARGEPVRVVFVTNGDRQGTSLGLRRQAEGVSGQAALGTAEQDVIFLGYPNGGLVPMYEGYNAPDVAWVSPTGVSATYGTRGLGGMDYHSYRWGSPGLYNWPTLVEDLADLIGTFRPRHIFTVSKWELHEDHAATNWALTDALAGVVAGDPSYNPTLHTSFVWPGDSNNWPNPVDPTSYFVPTPNLDPAKGLVWEERESLDVPLEMQSWVLLFNPKALAMSAHRSQGGVTFLEDHLHKDEFFWVEYAAGGGRPPVPSAGADQVVQPGRPVILDATGSSGGASPLSFAWRQVEGPVVALSSATSPLPAFIAPATDGTLVFELVVGDGTSSSVPDAVSVLVQTRPPDRNIALEASVTASSESAASSQTALKAIDGVVAGYPMDQKREWVTLAERAGAWIELSWPAPHGVNRVVLHDRPLLNQQVTRGTITFSDGSSIPVGPLDNNGRGVEVPFPSRTVSWLRFTVEAVGAGTGNVGLAEISVFEPAGAPVNLPPVAHAGPDQAVSGGTLIALNGTESSDPEGHALTYAWTQTGGAPVALSDAASPAPTFRAPAAMPTAQSLTFQLVVHDGTQSSSPARVTVTVAAQVSVPVSTPYGGVAWRLPGTIQAEDFDEGGEGVAYHETTKGNQGGVYRSDDVDIERTTDTAGGYNVAWMTAREWLAYTVNVTAAGTYTLRVRVAADGGGRKFHLEAQGRDVSGPLAIPNTGGRQIWATVEAPVQLAAGVQVLRLVMDAGGPKGVVGNVNWLSIQ